jgi:hypothetical protein
MGLLNGPYAQYFRKNMRMRGYLFQDRYKSIVTQDQMNRQIASTYAFNRKG